MSFAIAFDQSLSRSFQLFLIREWWLPYHREAERVVPATQQRFLDMFTQPSSRPRGEEIRTRLPQVVGDGQPLSRQPLGHPGWMTIASA